MLQFYTILNLGKRNTPRGEMMKKYAWFTHGLCYALYSDLVYIAPPDHLGGS